MLKYLYCPKCIKQLINLENGNKRMSKFFCDECNMEIDVREMNLDVSAESDIIKNKGLNFSIKSLDKENNRLVISWSTIEMEQNIKGDIFIDLNNPKVPFFSGDVFKTISIDDFNTKLYNFIEKEISI